MKHEEKRTLFSLMIYIIIGYVIYKSIYLIYDKEFARIIVMLWSVLGLFTLEYISNIYDYIFNDNDN